MSSISRRELLGLFRDPNGEFAPARIDLKKLSAEDWQMLEGAGLGRGELEKLAGKDGVIADRREIEALFDLLDRFDKNGSNASFAITTRDRKSGLELQTPAGRMLEVLSDRREAVRQTGLAQFINRFQDGEFDLSQLDARAEGELAAIGIPVKTLRRIADDDGRIAGAGAVRRLFYAIDRIDDNGQPGSYDTSLPTPLDAEVPEEAMTKAGRAEWVLSGLFRPYDQPFRQYSDLSRALKPGDPAPKSVSVKVKHVTQWNATACFKAAYQMLVHASNAAGRYISPAGNNHYMARAEGPNGEITGRADDFTRGRAYIDFCLEHGRPLIVGLSHKNDAYNLDRITDHFVVISGRGVDAAGRVYYTYDDPATSGEHRNGRFYVDADTSMLFRPALTRRPYAIYERGYQVSSVSTYVDPGFRFEEVTGTGTTAPTI